MCIPCEEKRLIQIVKNIYVDKIIGCWIDKGSREHPIDGNDLEKQTS